MRVNFNPFKCFRAALAFIFTAIQKLVAAVAKARFAAPQANPKPVVSGEVIPLPAPNKASTATSEVAKSTIIAPADAPQKPPQADVAAPAPFAGTAASGEPVLLTPRPLPPAGKPRAPTTLPFQQAPAAASADRVKTVPGKLNANQTGALAGINFGAPGRPMPKPAKPAAVPAADLATQVATEKSDGVTESVVKKQTIVRPIFKGKRPPTRGAKNTIVKEDQRTEKPVEIKDE